LSEITGAPVVRWTGEPIRQSVPVMRGDKPVAEASRPAAYWIPAPWTDVIERLRIHGVEMEAIREPRALEVEMYHLENPQLSESVFEGHVQVTAVPRLEVREETFAPGSMRISMDQPLGELIMLLLEPASGDSFFQWGFFHEILARTEYVEEYVMEPMARRMLDQSPGLAAEFQEKLQNDAAFRGSPQRRLEWFYQRTPFFDERWRLYPVARERN
ncbi:MAG TPA: carboxypeptidase, partial [Thermoanaerobaculia bacterium]|nr:carboxypeptidase [Thermoanaerobaculia bacterium]